MIFRPELAKLIVQGRKTQTRRIVDGRDCRYQPGRSYAVQPGRGKRSTVRITVLEVRRERLGEMPIKDARREGFATRQEFFDYWESLYGRVDRDLSVWVISFVLGDLADQPRLLAARCGAPHGDYVSEPHLAMAGEPEAISGMEAERFGKLAHARDASRVSDPLRQSRDRIARELALMRGHVGEGDEVAKSIRRLERELVVLDRKIAA